MEFNSLSESAKPVVVGFGIKVFGALKVLLVVGILGYFGIQTTSFAALLAALGIAIGAAWSGLLANFAAGAFIRVLRPFKVGDYVQARDVEGTVRAVGMLITSIDTPDNVLTAVGNGKIMAGTIKNFSHDSGHLRRRRLSGPGSAFVRAPAGSVVNASQARSTHPQRIPNCKRGSRWDCSTAYSAA